VTLRVALGSLLATASAVAAPGLSAQAEAHPVLSGTVYVADTLLTDGTVVLHYMSDGVPGEVDSVRVVGDGAFSFELPNAPDPERQDVFFASIRHDDVLYFGPLITRVMDLDSIYEIHAYDTLLAPSGGIDVVLEARSIFFEPDEAGGWRVTDLFQVRNERDRTVVARPGGRTWSHPLPSEAREVEAGEGEMSVDASRFEDGDIVVRAALPPGERLFVARYHLDSPFVSIPSTGPIETLDVLVSEPAPAFEIEGLEPMDRVEIDPGSTFRRYTAEPYDRPSIQLVQTEERGPPPVQWFAVIMALVLTAAGLVALRTRTPAQAAPGASRDALLLEVARLDEEFEAIAAPSTARRRAYQRRRRELLGRLRPGS